MALEGSPSPFPRVGFFIDIVSCIVSRHFTLLPTEVIVEETETTTSMTRIASPLIVSCLAIILVVADAFSTAIDRGVTKVTTTTSLAATRRSILEDASKSLTIGAASLFLGVEGAKAREVTNASSGELPDLPADAARSYLQYRFPLQLAADFYVFDLQTMVGDTGA